MKVILNQTIDDLGSEGEILVVKDGYARNYLLPKGWAQQATTVNIIATQKNIELIYSTLKDKPPININKGNSICILNLDSISLAILNSELF